MEYEQDCIEFHNNIKIAAKTINDDFLRIKDYTGNELILYIYENSIYVPHCEENYHVFIYHLDDCFEYIPIRWLVDRESNFKGTGYLTDEKIIVSESVRIQCKDKPNIEIENNTRLIQGKKIKTNEYEFKILKNTRTYEKIRSLKLRKANFEHFKGITRNVEKSSELKSITVKDQTFYYTDSKQMEDNTLKNKILSYINEIEDDWNKVKSIISYIVATTILTIITTTIIAISSRSRIQKTERRINLIEDFLPTN